MDELERLVNEILKGIDKDEVEDTDGWWETSTGAEFGRKKKAELIAAIRKLLSAPTKVKCLVCGKSFEVANERDWQGWRWSGLSNLPQHACNLSARSDVSVTDQHVENNGTVDVEVSETE